MDAIPIPAAMPVCHQMDVTVEQPIFCRNISTAYPHQLLPAGVRLGLAGLEE